MKIAASYLNTMKLSIIIKGALAFLLAAPPAKCDILKFMDECTTHCKKTHTKMGNINDVENAATGTRHTSEDIVVTSVF
ncbi:hypothetical protein MACJ_004004 [Theileria orientalis]|uniref:Uncharacterized protein n=1 Tax=Theileria orientalis TaxID=68886 RepID=A0A976XJZ8_THEOR|nr:hypothetical protein MACJ_004004 [Theileria orientalis]